MTDMIKKMLRDTLVDGLYWRDKYNRQKKHALKALKTEEENNSQKLSPKIKKLADDYAVEVFGKKEYAVWLYVYSLSYGEFKEGWIPADFYERYVSPMSGLNLVTCYKAFTNVALKTEALPDLAYYINGSFYSRDFSVIKFSALREIIGKQCTEVFVKKDYSARGRGIHKYDLASVSEDTIRRIGNCVIQLSVKNHKFFEEIMPDSLSTIRITTVTNPEGKIEYRAAFLRVGRKNDSFVVATKEIDVAIMGEDGEFDSYGYSEGGGRYLRHPDTNYEFANKCIPLFKDAVETCVKLHASVPHFRIIGWDIAISDDEKIRLLEWNGAFTDIIFHQCITGPCFSGLNWEQLRKNKTLAI
jgi:hypothetical protein